MLVLSGCDIKFGVDNSKGLKTSSNGTLIDGSYEIGDANSIVISSEIANSSIKTYDGDKIKIVGVIGTNSKGINCTLNGNEVIVKEEYSNMMMGGIGNNNNDISEYQILIPESYKGNMSVEYGAGTINIEDIKVDKLNIKGGVGELTVGNIVFNDMELSSGVGSVNISLADKCGNINIKGGVGETVLKMKEVGGNLKVDGGIGSIDIEVPKDAPIYFESSSGIGSRDVANVKTSGEKTYLFSLNVGLGDLSVHN